MNLHHYAKTYIETNDRPSVLVAILDKFINILITTHKKGAKTNKELTPTCIQLNHDWKKLSEFISVKSQNEVKIDPDGFRLVIQKLYPDLYQAWNRSLKTPFVD